MWAGRNWGPRLYDIEVAFNGQAGRRPGHPAGRRGQCAGYGRGRQGEDGGNEPLLPAGMKVVYPYDTTPFVKVAIEEVVKTLIEAIVLVFLVMYLFLRKHPGHPDPDHRGAGGDPGNLRACWGSSAYSINMLTMFAMVLAIGLLVDDAIVVVENVERIMSEEGLSPRRPPPSPWTRSPAP